MEFKAKWDDFAGCYIVYCNGREIGKALDVEGVGQIIQFWQEKNE